MVLIAWLLEVHDANHINQPMDSLVVISKMWKLKLYSIIFWLKKIQDDGKEDIFQLQYVSHCSSAGQVLQNPDESDPTEVRVDGRGQLRLSLGQPFLTTSAKTSNFEHEEANGSLQPV